jgi:arylsulfatase A-like enzyme
MRRLPHFLTIAVVVFFAIGSQSATAADAKLAPNIVFILCDDLGYGDVGCLNPEGKIKTPQLDRLASQGMIFTDAHSGSGVCTPTRYGIVTGRYAWRTKLQSGVLGGLSPRLIEPDRMTVASMLKKKGYATACIGKWHLGLDWVKKEGKQVTELNIESAQQVNNVDYSQPFTNGPTAMGFDYYFGISASLDMVPYTFLENDRCTVLPTAENSFPMMLGKPGNKTRLGPAAPEFDANQVLPTLTAKAVEFLKGRANSNEHQPFFLYVPLASPHTPIVPTKDWQEKSGLNPYADFVMQTDACIGEILQSLEFAGDNTLVIVTSDNGCSPQADFPALLAKGHNPSYQFRGTKADIYEGGHRVPFIARWPGQVKAGSKSDQVVCLGDLMATAAELAGIDVPDDAAEDSISLVPALTGKESDKARSAIVHHSINGSFAIREGNWKLCFCPGSGGWSSPRPQDDTSDEPLVQLFDLANDIGEKTNLAEKEPAIVERLTKLMEKYVADGRSTPGVAQKNAVAVDFWKAGKAAHQPKKEGPKKKDARK